MYVETRMRYANTKLELKQSFHRYGESEGTDDDLV